MLTATRGGAEMALTYDNAGRKLTMDDPDMGDWSYAYDALGNMTRQQDAKNQVTCLYYDDLNRLKGKNYLTNGAMCPSNDPESYSVTYIYDIGANSIGRRHSMAVTGGDYTSWNYDIRGRVTSENKQIPGGGQFVTGFTYNSADLPVMMTYPDNETVTFTYNNNMLPTSVTGTSQYAQSIAYDSAMRMIQLVRGANKINTVFDYNDWNVDGGRLLNLTSTQVSTGTTLQNLTYDYDSVGNIATIVESNGGTPPVLQTQTFQYDELDRLINSNVTGGTNGLYSEGYTYETSTGNLKTKGGGTPNTYTYDTTHKHAVASLSNGNTYGYDANGNMTSRNVGGQSFTLNYDAENRLVSVTGASTANFYYDADGKQVKATVNGVTTVYVGQHYEEKSGTVTKYYFAGATRIAVRTDGTLSYLLGDHLGSSSVTTNASGAKTASALYKAFGETRYTFGNLGTDYKFTGQRLQAELGIYWFQSRWMDPSLGRFTSPDTIVPTSTQGTQAWDRYGFVNNNPVRYTDPTGHQVTCDDGYLGSCVDSAYRNHSTTTSNDILNCNGPVKSDVCAPSQPPTKSKSSSDPFADIVQKDDDETKEPDLTSPESSELSFGEKLGLVVATVLLDVVLTAIIIGIAYVMVTLAGTGIGVVLDVFVLLPVELFFADLEIGVSMYTYNVVKTGTREGHEMEFHFIIPLLQKLAN